MFPEFGISKNSGQQKLREGRCWCGLVVITTAELASTKSEFRFCTGSNPGMVLALMPFIGQAFCKNNTSSS